MGGEQQEEEDANLTDEKAPLVIEICIGFCNLDIQRLSKQKMCWLSIPSLSSCYSKFLQIQFTNAVGDALTNSMRIGKKLQLNPSDE